MSSAINASFPQTPLVVPKSLISTKTPFTDPDTNTNSQAASPNFQTTAQMMAKLPPWQEGSSSI
jgi:hypothetical protein